MSGGKWICHAALLASALLVSSAIWSASPALAADRVQIMTNHERAISRHISQLRRRVGDRELRLSRKVSAVREELHTLGEEMAALDVRSPLVRVDIELQEKLAWLERSERRRHDTTAAEIRHLLRARAALKAWLARFGVFKVCPVASPRTVLDNFGMVVRIPGVPVHLHEGDDIIASLGTPIVAPFAGTATSSTDPLGGLDLYVHGPDGYVLNAHLSALSPLSNGPVSAGAVIGYVGESGDAAGPHDHFEWHPTTLPAGWAPSPYGHAIIGTAVNPFPLLQAVCG
jgi:murein DD-endopeptidase MepM/ murein hydrolase activator NlpD